MYQSILNFKDTQIAIKQVKDFFQKELAAALNLMRVTAPLMVGKIFLVEIGCSSDNKVTNISTITRNISDY